MKLTEWYPYDIKPKRKGVYMTTEKNEVWFQYWSGTYWKLRAKSVFGAFSLREFKSQHQQVKWKGIER